MQTTADCSGLKEVFATVPDCVRIVTVNQTAHNSSWQVFMHLKRPLEGCKMGENVDPDVAFEQARQAVIAVSAEYTTRHSAAEAEFGRFFEGGER